MKVYIRSFIKRLFCIVLFSYPLFGFSQIKSSDIDYLRIAEIELSNDSLFFWQHVRPMLSHLDSTRGTFYKITLSNKEKSKFLKLIDRLNLLNMQSNNKQKTAYLPFVISYRIKGQKHSISAYKPGMSDVELKSFEKYLASVEDIIDLEKKKEKLLLTLADGQYQISNSQKYEIRIGPSVWKSWEKKNNELKRIGMPLLIVDGKVKNANFYDKINPKKIKSFQIMKPHEAESLYGTKVKDDVIVIYTK